MKDLTHTKVIVVGGTEVIVRELTVAGVRNLMTADKEENPLDASFFQDVRLSDLQVFTSLTKEEVSDLYPSQIRLVIDACRELNPDFFSWLAQFSQTKPAE